MLKLPEHFSIILSRTDSIGDVVLTLPMAGYLKKHFPECRVIFLGRNYTKEVVRLSEFVDEFLSWDDLKSMSSHECSGRLKADVIVHVFPVKEIAQAAKKAGIPWRVGTTNRVFHWATCNHKIKLSRRNSDLHEAQLNIKLLEFLNIDTGIALENISKYYGFTKTEPLNDEYRKLINENTINVILHPKSKGSAREWGLENFSGLIKSLPKDRYTIYISGTKEEGEMIKPLVQKHPEVINLTGRLNLGQFISFIQHCDALVAASTGPLHIASALNKDAIGLFAPMKPIDPGRWRPLGENAHYLVLNKECNDCKKSKNCHCIREITVKQVVDLLSLIKK